MRNWRTVTEYVPMGDRLVVWSVEDRTIPGASEIAHHYAGKSPLTGWWFVRMADGACERHPTLIRARRRVLGGNGFRAAANSEVTDIRNVPRYTAQQHRNIVTVQVPDEAAE